MKKRAFLAMGFFLFLVGSGTAGAQDGLKMVSGIFQKIEGGGSGQPAKRETVNIADIKPGAVLAYVITYRNTGDQPIKNAVVAHPVPEELEYISTSFVKGGDSQAAFEVSVDEGKSYGDLSRLSITQPDGTPRPARAKDVTAVRWTIQSGVGAKEDAFVSIRGKVKEPTP
jgi:uncharacterized repeat protein (TIGR01451 family)